jgi:hypothetical protein
VNNSLLQKLVRVLWRLVRWLHEQLEDNELRSAILAELGMNDPIAAPPPLETSQIEAVEAYLAADDPDVLAFIEVADSVAAIFDTLETFFSPIFTGAGGTLNARDALYVLFQLGAIELLRRDSPPAYATLRALGYIDDQIATHELPIFDFDRIGDAITVWEPLETEQDASALADVMFLAPYAVWRFLRGILPEHELVVVAGWDSPPGSTDLADSISRRAVTWAVRVPATEHVGTGLITTWIAIPEEHGGPGLFLSLSGELAIDISKPGEKRKISVTFPEAASFFFGEDSQIVASANAAFELEYIRGSGVGGPAVTIPRSVGTRLEITNLGIGVTVRASEAIAKVIFERAAIIVTADDADDFTSQVFPAGGVRVDFDLAVGWDFIEGKLFFGASSRLEVVIPIGKTLGPLTVFHVTIGFGERQGELGTRELAVRLAFSIKLLALTAVVEQIGVGFSLATSNTAGRLGPIEDAGHRFLAPKGIGLHVNGGGVSGGGFLFFDPDNDEYAGVLALEIGGYSLKVVGLIKTELDAPPGFSLLLIGSVQGLTISLFAGGLLTGIGLIFGMHRTISVPAFQAGIKNKALDAVLFPEDPIANAPQIIAALKTLFPPATDQWIVGLSAQVSWISKKIVRIELALLVEFPSPVRIALLGQATLMLPAKDVDIVLVNFDVIGILDLEEKFLSIDSVLYSSRIGTFPMTGGMAVRARWGADPSGAGALGGLHPRFPLPEGFPRLSRLAVTIGKGNNPRIRGEVYIGVTSNTFQFGVRAELYAGAGGFSVEGDISLDLLFRFDPFRFLAELSFRAAVKYKGHTLAGLKVTGSLEGPGLWHAKGKVRIKILFIKVSKSFSKIWGEESGEQIEPVEVAAALEAALVSAENWSGQLPAAARAFVALRPVPPSDFVDVHPGGTLEVVQRVVPLGVEMTKFRNAPIAGERRFDITAARLNGTDIPTVPVTDHFAAGQHLDLGSDDEAVSRPSFEDFPAGVRITSAVVTRGAAVTTNFEYEEIVINENIARPSFFGVHRIPAGAALAAAEHGSAALSGRKNGGRYAGPHREVARRDSGFVAATVAALTAVPIGVRQGASYTEVSQAIAKHEAAHPDARGRVQIVRAHETQAA